MTDSNAHFRSVLRGYDPAQVDQHVHQLGAATAAARQEAAERTIEVTKLETAAGQLRSEVERHVQRARTLEEEKMKASAPTFTTLGERIGSILTLADEEANEMRTRAQADAANHHALADESALATRRDADHYATEMRSAAEAEAARFIENTKRQADSILDDADREANGPAGGGRSGGRGRTRQGRDCRSGLRDHPCRAPGRLDVGVRSRGHRSRATAGYHPAAVGTDPY